MVLHHPGEQARRSCDQETEGGGAQLAFFLNANNAQLMTVTSQTDYDSRTAYWETHSWEVFIREDLIQEVLISR